MYVLLDALQQTLAANNLGPIVHRLHDCTFDLASFENFADSFNLHSISSLVLSAFELQVNRTSQRQY